MLLNQVSFRKYFIVLALMLFSGISFGQEYTGLTRRIDSLAAEGLPKSALAEVDKLERLARKNNNSPMIIRAAIYRITFLSYLEENALTAVITTLKGNIQESVFPTKPVLQSLLAEMYWKYYMQNRWQFSQRTRLEEPDPDITRWDLRTIISETNHLYQLSLSDVTALQKTPVNILDGVLDGDTATRYLRPTLYDLLVHRAFDFFLSEEPALPKPKLPFRLNDALLFSDSRTFARRPVYSTDTTSTIYHGIKYLQQAVLFHLEQNNREAVADLDLKRLDFLYTKAAVPDKDSLYLQAILQVASSFEDKPLSADALVMAGKYYQQKDNLQKAYTFFKHAVSSYPESLGGKNAAVLIEQIESKQLNATVEQVNVPDKPLLAQLSYKNIKEAAVEIYKLSLPELDRYKKLYTRIRSRWQTGLHPDVDSVLAFLTRHKPVQSFILQLPGSQDYRLHSTEFKIDPLRTGQYVLLVKDFAGKDSSLIKLAGFTISRLAYVTRKDPDGKTEVRVMDRETGMPLKGVSVLLRSKEYKYNSKTTRSELIYNDYNGISDQNGMFKTGVVSSAQFDIKLSYKTDVLAEDSKYIVGMRNNDDDIPENKTVLFTDRQIYRPGQTIYFKGIQLQTFNGESKIVAGKDVRTSFIDVNNKEISSVLLKTNEFGSFSGTFIIPAALLNGSLKLKTDNGEIRIQVEEYKRPSFKVEFTPLKESFRLNDSVQIKGKVTAFSGYGLSQARVAYRIVRTRNWNDIAAQAIYGRSVPYLPIEPAEIAAGIITTDNQGNYTIRFKALPEDSRQKGVTYRYEINADVTDGSGETHSGNTTVTLGDRDVSLSAHVSPYLRAKDSCRALADLTTLNGQRLKGNIRVEVYALQSPSHLFKKRIWDNPDQYILSSDDYKKHFPDYACRNEDQYASWPQKERVIESQIQADTSNRIMIDLDNIRKQPSGVYRLIVRAKTDAGDTASVVQYFKLINQEKGLPLYTDNVIPVTTSVQAGENAEFLAGVGGKSYLLVERYHGATLLASEWMDINSQQSIKIPSAGSTNTTVQFMMVYQNRLYKSYHYIYVKHPEKKLELSLLTFRNLLEPGQKEEWKLQVSGHSNEKQAAEMVAGLYDASLDDISSPQNWSISTPELYSNYFSWEIYNFVSGSQTEAILFKPDNYSLSSRNYEHLNLFGYSYYGGYNNGYRQYLQRVSNKNKNEGPQQAGAPLHEIVTVGYGALREEAVGSSADLRIRGTNSVNQTSDKVTITGAIADLGVKTIAGDPSAGIKMDEPVNAAPTAPATQSAIVNIRKNFNETAFFYPQLHTDENGQVLIGFTIPEALTKWRFKAFAHTQKLAQGYLQQDVFTRKQLMVSANMPRFLREGDTITVSARVANLTAQELKAAIKLNLFNALNMQQLSLLTDAASGEQTVEIAASTNTTVSFKLVVPAGLEALTYRLTAVTEKHSDGEENTIPVLSDRMLVTESMPMMVRSGQTASFKFDKLLNNRSSTLVSKTLTLEYTQNPAWYAVQAMPYLMEFPYECSEQIFSRYFANSLSSAIVNQNPLIKQVFEQWKSADSKAFLSNLEKNPELKSVLLEETPWLQNAMGETEQKKRIALLFDLNTLGYEQAQTLEKLLNKQLPDGGFPWFGGTIADRYITQHILAGIGQLHHLKAAPAKDQQLTTISRNALDYLDSKLISDYRNGLKNNQAYKIQEPSSIEIYAWYARSYYPDAVMNNELKEVRSDYLSRAMKYWTSKGLYEKGMIALTMQRSGKPDIAVKIIRSLMETAQQSNEMGMYWPNNRSGWFWYESPVETQALMISLFTEVGGQSKAVEEMKIWLLRNKQTNNWKTTKATAAACYALLMQGNKLLTAENNTSIKLGGKLLNELKPEIKAEAGTGYIKTSWVDEQIKPELGRAEISNESTQMSWGALHWQYTEKMDKITPSATDITLERKYFIVKRDNSGEVLTAVDEKNTPQTGDLLKVVVYLKAGRDYEYVQLKDMRPSGTEPADVLSAYKYQDGLYYYQVTKDVATNFFISRVNKGNYVFEYRLRVVQPGNFSTGISSVQCMYAPEFNAHSEGRRLTISK